MTEPNTQERIPPLSQEEKKELKCGKCFKQAQDGEKLHLCSACKTIRYCSPECQKSAWKIHKIECKKLVGMKKIGDRVEFVTTKLMETWGTDVSMFKKYCKIRGVSLKRSVFTIPYDEIVDIHNTTDIKEIIDATNKWMQKEFYHQTKEQYKTSDHGKAIIEMCQELGFDTFIITFKSKDYAYSRILKIL